MYFHEGYAFTLLEKKVALTFPCTSVQRGCFEKGNLIKNC